MAKKWFGLLCIAIFIAVLCTQNTIQPITLPISNTKITTQSVIGGGYGILANYSKTGDFLSWVKLTGNFFAFDNTHNYLYVKAYSASGSQEGECGRGFNSISTNHLRTYKIRCYAYGSGTWPVPQYWLRLYLTNGSYIQLFDRTTFNTGSYTWFNGTLPPNIYLTGIFYWSKTGAAGQQNCFSINYERYDGWFPSLENWTVVPIYIKINTPTVFATLAYNASAQVNLLSPFGGALIMQLGPDWALPHRYSNVTSFAYYETYAYSYTAYNEWGLTITSPIYYFTVSTATFPKDSYLSLFNNLTGFPLESKDFKIFLGQPDSRECINFRTFYGTWNQLNYLNTVNASCIDNYIAIQADHNGLYSPFEHGMVYDTIIYNTLQFQVKAFNPTWLVLIYNPAIWEKDFYFQLTQSQVGYWIDITIPFFNFTSYVDVTHNNLYELGFWVENATILLANIRVSQYYTVSYTFYNQVNSLYETHFNFTQTITHNIRIKTNQTIELAPEHPALYTFTDDLDGNDPIDWLTNEPSGTSVQVITAKGNHNKVVECWDNSNALNGQCGLQNAFSSSKTTGMVEFWFMRKSGFTAGKGNITFTVDDKVGGLPGNIAVNLKLGSNILRINSMTLLTNFQNNTWYHIRLQINCTSQKVHTWINLTDYGLTNFYTVTAHIDRFFILTADSDTAGNTYCYLDAVDYSWASGYYINRNYNNTPTDGYYESKIYNLGIADQIYAYSIVYAINQINISYDILLQYRTSTDNITWTIWSSPITINTTIALFIAQYFQFKVLMYSTDFASRQCYWMNLSYSLINTTTTTYTPNSYRLCSLQNRQNPNNLVFFDPLETICIMDFYNNVLYYADVAYTPFLDIGLPITTATFYNWENYSAVIRIYRGLGVYLELVVAPRSSITTELFCTNYRVWVANQHLQQLYITYFSPNRTPTISETIGQEKATEVGRNFWQELIDFLFGTPLGLFLFIVIVISLSINVVSSIYSLKRWRDVKRRQKARDKPKPVKWDTINV
jgi:hypothetical protein